LQDPADYVAAMQAAVQTAMRAARARPEQLAGIGTDFTSCTMLPTDRQGAPLCLNARWRREPHAWVKLWKHHAAQGQADAINRLGRRRGERFMDVYGKYSSEWFFSKLLETVQHAPEVYEAAGRFLEAGDWIVWQLCGEERRGQSAAGFKAMWVYPDAERGWTYPSRGFFRALDPRLASVAAEKLEAPLLPVGARAGGLTHAMAARLGLLPGTPVAVGNIDAHVAVPACGVVTPGRLVMIMGTSTCHLLLARKAQLVSGICGVVENGIVPGLWGYEAGQPGVGDLFAWYIERLRPGGSLRVTRRGERAPYQRLEQDALRLRPGQSGLLALDWWNGNRSVLANSELSGVLAGCTLATEAHEIYRALMEATAFGTRRILEAFEQQGVAIGDVVACGGLAHRSPLLLQIYADVTGRPIRVAASEHTSALGAAMHAAIAAGLQPSFSEAAARMARLRPVVYRPRRNARAVYDELYRMYVELHDYFGREPAGMMRALRRLRAVSMREL
jgi:L-ribulokinase